MPSLAPPTVDAHLHFFSRNFFEALAAQSPWPGTVEEKLARLRERGGPELPEADVAAHTRRWLAEAERHGVEHLCAFASVPEEIGVLAEARRLAPERITPFALVNPRGPGVVQVVTRLIDEQGFGGVLLFPALHHVDVGGEECESLLGVLHERRAWCYVHCGLFVVPLRDKLGLPRTQDLRFANPLSIVPAANRFPGVRFVIPHLGAGFLRETLLVGAQSDAVLTDTSSSHSWMRTQAQPTDLAAVLARALGVFGPERILFGTDSGLFPAGWREERRREQLAALERAGASPEVREAILCGNARRLLAALPGRSRG